MKNLKYVLLIGAGAFAVNQASANLVINGNFAAGDLDFTSDYGDGTGIQNSLLNAGGPSIQGGGYYAVGTDPKFYNPNWTYGPISVPNDPNAQMLIVNGALAPSENVPGGGAANGGPIIWQGELSSTLIAGDSYTFSVKAASLYQVAEPTLTFSIGETPIGSINLTGAGTWQTFSTTFVAGSGFPSFVDLNTEFSGNDFVVSEISITPVPEPTTIVAGAMLLLPFGMSTLRMLRKNRAV